MILTGYDINLRQGNDYSLPLCVRNSAGTPINLSGYTFSTNIKYRPQETGSRGSFDVTILSTGSGRICLSISSTGSAALPCGKLLYELETTDSAGEKAKYLLGNLNVYYELNNL